MLSSGPVILDLDGAFTGPDRDALLRRHERYGKAFADISESGDEALNIVVPRSFRQSLGLPTTMPHVNIIVGLPQLDPGFLLDPRRDRVGDRWSGTWVASDPFKTGPLQLFAARRCRGKLQVQVHGDFGLQAQLEPTSRQKAKLSIAGKVLRAADSIRAVTVPQAVSIARRFLLDPAKIFIAHVPIDEAFLTTPFDESERERRVLFVGRLHKERGLESWAEAARETAHRDPSVRFEIVGAGPGEAHFRSMLRGLRVTWHGRLGPEAIADLMGRSTVLLSTPRFESYGRSLVEGLCMGMRIVATETTGVNCLAKESGVAVASDPVTLADATLDALHEPCRDPANVQNFRSRQETLDALSIDALVRSWL